jgi:hypothetical protein
VNNQTARTRVRSYSKTLFRAEGGRRVAWNGAGFHFRLFFPGFFPSPLSLASRDFPFFFDGSFSFNPASRSVVFFKSPLPVASPLPPEDSAAAFFSAISALAPLRVVVSGLVQVRFPGLDEPGFTKQKGQSPVCQ